MRNVWQLYFHPREFFHKLPERGHWLAPLSVLLAMQVAVGLLLLSTGVPDREVAYGVQQAINQSAVQLTGEPDDVRRLEDKLLESQADRLRFGRMVARLRAVLLRPLSLAVGGLLVATLLFAGVSAVGRAPEMRLLAGIAVWASYVELPRWVLELFLSRALGVAKPELTAAACAPVPETPLGLFVLLRQFDPFAIWYWLLVGMGLSVTAQARPRQAVLVTLALALGAAVCHGLWDLPQRIDWSTFSYMAGP